MKDLFLKSMIYRLINIKLAYKESLDKINLQPSQDHLDIPKHLGDTLGSWKCIHGFDPFS